ncbi:hypothetical protein [Streptococcus hyovaginalis]|nr:hypothetical protein [Streptococcus hyovaginalis]
MLTTLWQFVCFLFLSLIAIFSVILWTAIVYGVIKGVIDALKDALEKMQR